MYVAFCCLNLEDMRGKFCSEYRMQICSSDDIAAFRFFRRMSNEVDHYALLFFTAVLVNIYIVNC